MRNNKIGIKLTDILLPKQEIDYYKWAVIACDQYTSQLEYWEEVDNIVGEDCSTLRLILPEVFLNEDVNTRGSRIARINKTMKNYLENGTLVTQKQSMIYLDRKSSQTNSRKGIILAIDLEKYDYNKGSQSLIRATEGTVLDRIPPRLKVRENALIELPHIMLLIDNPEKNVIEPISKISDSLEKIYDTDLMMDGGHIRGYKINQLEIINQIFTNLEKLTDKKYFQNKYNINDKHGILLFATGDGNHSLATAKVHWEKTKKKLSTEKQENHPARFALVEVVNIHDQGLTFEPIHRVIININPLEIINDLKKYLENKNSEVEITTCQSKEDMQKKSEELNNNNNHILPFVYKNTYGIVAVKNPKFNLEVGTLQNYLNQYIKDKDNIEIDYIHGEKVVEEIGSKENNIGFFLPTMNKNDLFKTIIVDGSLPRKTFSIGEAEEKRFYFESKKIV